MKIWALPITFCLISFLLLANSFYLVNAQNYVQYKVQINLDGSAVWTVTQASDVSGIIDTWQTFQQRILNLIGNASSQTQRKMSLDNGTIQMNTIWETQSHTTEYQFLWLNFSITQYERIIFGDVFQVKDFFNQFYGDGEIQFFYNSNYTLQSVSPQPNGGNTGPQTLEWLGTEFFINGNPNIILAPISISPSPTLDQLANNLNLTPYWISGIIVIIGVLGTLAFLLVKRRQNRTFKAKSSLLPENLQELETEEEKIIKVIRASGGSVYQSAIKEKCNFSKAKTSQLLTVLEKRGIVRRYKKGRDKIVTLIASGKGESP